MSDVIQLLPDSVANQIAAGEVVQRPASLVKELLENAIDAGATVIELILKEGGRTLVQVIDNGTGMSNTDARLSLERHATSKIRKSEDLFNITSMGFRGEAIASIVAIAQCEIKTRRESDEFGTRILVEGSKVIKQENCACSKGTSISVKNLFYNVPARRKFLKSNAVENRHIIDQFERVALVYPYIKFTMRIDDNELFHLPATQLRNRIVAIFGKNYNNRLVPIEEESNIVNLGGFICKPEYARKTRGEQYLFVNSRFVKSQYLHHAVLAAYEDLIPKGQHPSYFIQIECDPSFIDINIHPTKTEIKFEDERSVYAILRTTVKKSLGEHNIAPSLDFNRETAFDGIDEKSEAVLPNIPIDTSFNPFEKSQVNSKLGKAHTINLEKPSKEYSHHIEQFFGGSDVTQQPLEFQPENKSFIAPSEVSNDESEGESQIATNSFMQLHGKYIITAIKSGLLLIDQRRAHERVMFEQFLHYLSKGENYSQKSLFPINLEFNAQDSNLVSELLPQLRNLGFDIEEFGKNAFIMRGIPAGIESDDSENLIESLIEQYKSNEQELELDKNVNLAFSLAQKSSIKTGRKMQLEEISHLVDRLFACESPYTSPTGKSIIINLSLDELYNRFN